MNYSEVFSKAWQIVWKFKALWIFGILSSCARAGSGGGGGSIGGRGGSSHLINSGGVFASPNVVLPKQVYQWYLQTQSAWDTEPLGVFLIVLAVFFVVMAMVVLSLFLGVLGRVGVARGAWLADAGEEKLNFSRIFNESKPYYWRVFLFFLLLFVASIAIGGLVAIPILLVIVFTLGLGLLFLIPLFIVVAFELSTLGEAVRALPEDIKNRHSEIPWEKIQGIRNVLIHEYFRLDEEIIWKTVQQDIPNLKSLLEYIDLDK